MSSFSANLYPEPYGTPTTSNQFHATASSTSSAPSAPNFGDEPTQAINWDQRLKKYQESHKVPSTQRARIMRPVGIALSALAVAFGKLTAVSLTMTATPLVVLGSVGTLSLMTLATASIGIYLLIFRTYNNETPQSKIKQEQKIVEELQSNKNLKWSEVLEKFPNGISPFNKAELDIIYFRDQVASLTARAFIGANGLEGISQLTLARKGILADKFLGEIAQENKGLLEVMKNDASALRELGILRQEVWARIRESEVKLPFTNLIQRNGKEILGELAPPQIQTVASSLLNEIPARKDIKGHRETLKDARTLKVEDKCKAKFAEWLTVNRAGRSLQALVTAYGLDIVDPIFIPSKNDVVITAFIGSCDFDKDQCTIQKLLDNDMLLDADKKNLLDRFKTQMKQKQRSWKDIQSHYPSFVRTQGVTLESVMPSIEEHEVTLGYAEFVKRNGKDAFKCLSNTSKEKLQLSFLDQVKFRNLNESIELPAGSADLGITIPLVEARRVRWFKEQLANIQDPTIQSLVKRFGSAVISEKYLAVEAYTTIVRRSLATLAFGEDDAVFDRLLELSYLNETQRQHLNTTLADIAKLKEGKKAELAKADADYSAGVNAVEGKYAPQLAQTLQQEQQVRAHHEQVINQTLGAINSTKAQLNTFNASIRVLNEALAKKRAELKTLSDKILALKASTLQAETQLRSDAVVQAKATIAKIDSQLERIPVIANEGERIKRVAAELRGIQLQLNGISDNAQSLRTKLGDLAAAKTKDDPNVTRAALEEQRRAAANETGAGAAFAAVLPGSEHSRKLKELDEKIALKLNIEVLEQEIARLRSLPMEASDVVKQRRTELASELNGLEKAEALRVENAKKRLELNSEKEEQQAIIANHAKLPGKIVEMVAQYPTLEQSENTLRIEERDLQNQVTAAQASLAQCSGALQWHEAQLAEQIRLRDGALARVRTHQVQLDGNKQAEINALNAARNETIHEINIRFQALISQVCEKFRAHYV